MTAEACMSVTVIVGQVSASFSILILLTIHYSRNYNEGFLSWPTSKQIDIPLRR